MGMEVSSWQVGLENSLLKRVPHLQKRENLNFIIVYCLQKTTYMGQNYCIFNHRKSNYFKLYLQNGSVSIQKTLRNDKILIYH